MSISRRTALATGAAAITTAAISAPLAVKAAAVQGEDAPLDALHTAWRAAEARHDEANSIADDAEGAVFNALAPCPLDDVSNYPTREALGADLRTWEAAREAAIETGAGELNRRADAAHAASRTAFVRFMDAPAQTPHGVYLKFMAGLPEDTWEETEDLHFDENIMLRAIRADLERLAGEARPT